MHLSAEEKLAFAQILSQLTIRYDNLFTCSFAYSMGIHQRPTPPYSGNIPEDQDEENVAHLHLHFSPPLLRSASVRKFLVGCVCMLSEVVLCECGEFLGNARDCGDAVLSVYADSRWREGNRVRSGESDMWRL